MKNTVLKYISGLVVSIVSAKVTTTIIDKISRLIDNKNNKSSYSKDKEKKKSTFWRRNK